LSTAPYNAFAIEPDGTNSITFPLPFDLWQPSVDLSVVVITMQDLGSALNPRSVSAPLHRP
jgi:hypothetical protein